MADWFSSKSLVTVRLRLVTLCGAWPAVLINKQAPFFVVTFLTNFLSILNLTLLTNFTSNTIRPISTFRDFEDQLSHHAFHSQVRTPLPTPLPSAWTSLSPDFYMPFELQTRVGNWHLQQRYLQDHSRRHPPASWCLPWTRMWCRPLDQHSVDNSWVYSR